MPHVVIRGENGRRHEVGSSGTELLHDGIPAPPS